VDPVRICYAEEGDGEFIRWTANLLRTFLNDGSVALVRRSERPDLMLAGVWRPHPFPDGVPVVLVSNENWRLFPPHAPLSRYRAVVGLYPPGEPCAFIPYPYAAVHFDVPVEELYRLRAEFLKLEKTRFCCFVTSNISSGGLAAERIGLFKMINRWQRVDSGGKTMNNIGALAPRGLDYLNWIAQYRYMICLENSVEPNYITEKPFQAWFAGTVPIYYGSCIKQLNPEAIVDASGDVLAELKFLESAPDAYEAKRRAELCDPPISLEPFEGRFRALVLDPVRRERAASERP